ncbi:MAG: hypothetical protein US62_C0002G0002 [Candidatus Woesebacteria bacterium GW2011_GWA1_37_8]|uniref:Glycosyltransferase RgtA/B/C/D-like domain-containing protein n=1 Tax=Candidatus Woesebacteria bacterium GW2011_GWA1_37_8 TaxID=1618546 RepID=A0A0G0KB16_9BACT|nr:MAG: hypothetical protein US39_C0004G0074 [Microgenomates group bacterium GW2011_GWC1_37_12b]KKQ46319.1 MAG: hypothetical protein US62_C0002G0002 [Candidatus Woesebacteria bacterium GW2011_GWA1_37_8]
MKQFIKRNYTILVVLLIGLVLRLIIINQSLWLDEAIGAIAVRDYSFSGILSDFMKFDNHPPLYYLMLKFWTNYFGYSELALRLPSVVFGIASIYILYKLNDLLNLKKINKNISVILALLFATSQLHVYFSQEARMYSMAAFIATLSSYFYLKTIINGKYLDWLGFSLTIVLLCFTDYLPVLMIPVFFSYALLNVRKKSWWIGFLISFLPLIVVGIFWLPLFKVQSENGRWILSTVPKWAEVAGGANLKQLLLVWSKFVFGRVSLVNKTLYYLLVICFSIPFAYTFSKTINKNLAKNYYFYWFSIPVVLGFILSFKIPAFNYFRYIFILPAFYGLLITGLEKVKIYRNVIIASFILVNSLSLSIYFFNIKNHREGWKNATAFIDSMVLEGDVVVFSYPKPFAPYIWYSLNSKSFGATDSILATYKSIEITNQLVNGKRGVYYFEYLSGLSDPQKIVQKAIVDNNFRENNVYNFNGVGLVYYYTR